MLGKHYFIYITYLLAAIYLCRCENDFDNIKNSEYSISFTTSDDVSQKTRGNDNSIISTSEKILVNTTGNVTIKDKAFVFDGQKWICENNNYKWSNTNNNKLFVTALYPRLSNNDYSESPLYSNNNLEDILLAKDSIEYRQHITLKFKHLFSRISIILSEKIKKNLNNISIIVPYTVDSINKSSGEITLQKKIVTHSIDVTEKDIYNFIIPPFNDEKLKLKLSFDNETKEVEVPFSIFKSNTDYRCKIVYEEENHGIKTTSDFIIFSRLINNMQTSSSKSLSDFKDTENGKTRYKLLNDLYFTEEECKKIIPISIKTTGFEDIFDGNGHVLNNLKINPSYVDNDNTALFYKINNNGIVKNIIINNSSIIINKKESGSTLRTNFVGFIAVYNYGEIDNCIIRNVSITNNNVASIGCFASNSTGTISNCGLESATINQNARGNIGGFIGIGGGLIINCYNVNCQYKKENQDNSFGGFISLYQEDSRTDLINCYLKIKRPIYKEDAYLIYSSNVIKIENCFYNFKDRNTINKKNSKDIVIINTGPYDSNFCYNDTSIIDHFNSWIDLNQKNYNNIKLKKWIIGNDSIPAILE